MTRATKARIAQLHKNIKEQREWIKKCGGTREGYIRNYGDPSRPLPDGHWHGDGGILIFQADYNQLRQYEQELAFLTGKAQ